MRRAFKDGCRLKTDLDYWMPHQHPPGEITPKRLPGLIAPAVEGIAGEQRAVEGAPGCDAVVAGPSVVVLGASPGNCTAVWGWIDAEALMPLVDPVAAPTVDPAGEIADEPGEFEPDTFELGTFNGSEAQPGEVTAPLTDVPDIEQGVSVRPVPLGLACVAPMVAEAEGRAALGIGLTWA
jgi:hypothetical protein